VTQSTSWFWPVYTKRYLKAGPADVTRTRFCLYAAAHLEERIRETGETRTRTDIFPFLTHKKDFDGSTRTQIPAILEPFLPAKELVEHFYTPLWSFWRASYNATNQARSESLFWNFYRRDTRPDFKRWSFFFGLFQARQTRTEEELRIFFVPVKTKRDPNYEELPPVAVNRGNAAQVFLPLHAPAPHRSVAPALARDTYGPTHGGFRLLPTRLESAPAFSPRSLGKIAPPAPGSS
jgi:hypothetical protein